MAIRLGGRAIDEIRALFDWGAMGSWTDGQLLAQFLTRQEGSEPALRVLIHRHGPMVLGICRRILGDDDLAEDAFQSTFLVLVRKAESLSGSKLLANWLYGVAVRVAKKERARAARRRVVERGAAGARSCWPGEDVELAEMRAVIDEEVDLLPERYRMPLILCYVEGLRHEEVAQRLGCPVGTVESRLSRAREQLRTRLTRRGLAPTASVVGLISSPFDASKSVGLSAIAERTLAAAIELSSAKVGVFTALTRWVSGRALSLSPSLQAGIVASMLIVCTGMAAMGYKVFGAGEGPPRRNASAIVLLPKMEPRADQAKTQGKKPESEQKPATAQPDAKAQTPKLEPTPESTLVLPAVSPKAQTKEMLKPTRGSAAYAPPLTGITIDGQLDDWPVAIARYPIDKLLLIGGLGTGGLRDSNLETSADLSAAFSVGYDPKEQLIYLAVIVRDDKVVIGHSSHLDTDSLEVFIDGLHSDRQYENALTDQQFEKLELADVPVQQYIAIPGKGMIYGKRQATNPILMAGSLKNTKTRMAYSRKGDVTTYEWAIQVFDQYPDKPTKLEPGKRIGFDVAVADKDVPASSEGGYSDPVADRTAWIYWGPFWRGNKMLDAGALGELILVK